MLTYKPKDLRNRRERGDLKPGILSTVFLLVTDESRISYSQWRQYSFVWAIDPDWFRRVLMRTVMMDGSRSAQLQVFFRFYEFISTNRFTLKDIWREFHHVNETQTYVPGPLPAWHFTNIDQPVWPHA